MIGAIQNLRERRAFYRAVMGHVRPPVVLSGSLNLPELLRQYPDHRNMVKAEFMNGSTSEYVATVLLTVWVVDICETLPPSRADTILAELERWAERTVPSELPEDPIGRLAALAQSSVLHWHGRGKISEYEVEYCLSEIVGALKGRPARERQADRLVSGLVELTMKHAEANLKRQLNNSEAESSSSDD